MIEQAERNYEASVTSITRYCGKHSIPLLLVSPVCNLRDQSPLPLPGQKERLQEIEALAGKPLAVDSAALFLPLLKSLLGKNREDATAHFRIAQCFELLGNSKEARSHYTLAWQFDPCRYRAIPRLSDILQKVAGQDDGNTEYLDVCDDFVSQSRYCVPGNDLFLEHVHFTLDGHWLLAKLIGRAVVDRLSPGKWEESRVPTLSERNESMGIIPEDELVGYYLGYYLMENFPMNQSLDTESHQALLRQKIETTRRALGEERSRWFDSLRHAVQMDDLVDGLGREFLEQGKFSEAELYFRKSILRRPWMANGYLYAAVCRYKVGDITEAENMLNLSEHAIMPPTTRVLNDQRTLRNILRQKH